MKKILLLTSQSPEQDSVTSISKNIISAFRLLKQAQVTILAVEKINLQETAQYNSYDFIIVVHPIVYMSSFFKQLVEKTENHDLCFVFYIFGDFIRKASHIINLGEVLKNKKIKFIVASRAYQKLIRECLLSSNNLELCPFPITNNSFKKDPQAGKVFRKKHRLSEKDFVLLYTGRISPQKNIHLLIKYFLTLKLQKKHTNLKLFIVGNVDEFEIPTFYERKYSPGEYFQILKPLLSGQNDIIIIPRTSPLHLKEAYNGCDLFISLSLYHDEDFGYSPLEALMCGTPVLTTSWGGYKDITFHVPSFKSSDYVNSIGVTYTNGQLIINDEKSLKILSKSIIKSKKSTLVSKLYNKTYSVTAIQKRYLEILNGNFRPFKGFNDDFANLVLNMYVNNENPPTSYEKFYKSFWSLK